MNRLLRVTVEGVEDDGSYEQWAVFAEQPDGTWHDDDGDPVHAKDGSTNFFKFLCEEFEVIRKDETFWNV